MTASSNDPRPMAQPGSRQQGADVGGISSNMEGGLEDAMNRQAERRSDDASGAATVGQGASGEAEPRLDRGGHAEPGDAPASPLPASEPGRSGASAQAGVEPAVPPLSPAGTAPARPDGGVPPEQQTVAGSGPPESPDEGPVESLGRAVSDVILGTLDEDETPGEQRPDRSRRR